MVPAVIAVMAIAVAAKSSPSCPPSLRRVSGLGRLSRLRLLNVPSNQFLSMNLVKGYPSV
jgi:hypothetical protein